MLIFSIIVVSLNAAETMKPTIKSILDQTYTDFEVIVKDGGSTDGTLEKLPQDDRIKVHQEKDSSLYDAMNQATGYASGSYCIYMNCGDLFASADVLQKAADYLQKHPCDVLYGNYIRGSIVCKQAKNMTPFYLYRTPLCHQTIFFRTKLLQGIYKYDTRYKILADYNTELKMLKNGKMFRYIDLNVCRYLGGGISESKQGIEKKKAERKVIIRKNFSKDEQLIYGLKLFFTVPELRKLLYSEKSPQFIRKTYKKLVNIVNGR